jgi:hypothetical protein
MAAHGIRHGRRVSTPRRRDEERDKVHAAVQACLGSALGSWDVTINPSTSLAHWWVLGLTRRADGVHQTVFAAADERAIARELRTALRTVASDTCPDPTTSDCGGAAVMVATASEVPRDVRQRFEWGARQALVDFEGVYAVDLEMGRRADEIAMSIRAHHRKTPLQLFFPGAGGLSAEDVARIIGNVIEAMGPGFRPRRA